MDYSTWCELKRQCIEDYKNNKISIKERAEKLTEYDAGYSKVRYGFYLKYPQYINLNDIYEIDSTKFLVIKLILVIEQKNKKALEILLNGHNIKPHIIDEEDGYIFTQFFYVIDKNKISRLDIYDPEKSYYQSMNMPNFNYTVKQTELKNIFSEINYQLINPFNKLHYVVYLALNNGDRIYCQSYNFNGRYSPMFYDDLNIILRSIWEANTARLLNYLNINWQYEKQRYNLERTFYKGKARGIMSYTPDFFLENNIILEVKGFWDSISVEQVFLFKQQKQEYKHHVIDGDMYYSLDKIYKNKIKNWEHTNYHISKQTIPVVGINISDRKPHVNELKIGEQVFLERDKDNPYDKNAIKILNENGNMIGHMAKQWACIYAEKIDLGMKYNVIVKDKEPNILNITITRIDIEKNIIYDFLRP